MKLFFYNDRLNDISSNGSCTTASRALNQAAIELGHYADFKNCTHVIYLDSFDTGKRFAGKITVPYLISEYNIAPTPCVQNLLIDKPLCLAISQQTKDSFICAGYDAELIKVVYLGSNPQMWPDLKKRTRKIGAPLIYLTHITSNQRSGLENFIPAWLEFARGKNVKLIIKDQQNNKLAAIINEIDKDKQIIYDGKNLSYEKLVYLYSICHVHCYCNSVTSFGMPILDTTLSGMPQIVSKASAIKEFTNESNVEYVETYNQEISPLLMAEWQAFGLNNNLLDSRHYSKKLMASRPKYSSIIEKLEFSYKNLDKLVAKNVKFCDNIRNELTWKHSVKKIVEILKNK